MNEKEVLGVMSPELKVESMKFTNLDLARPNPGKIGLENQNLPSPEIKD